ncbi:Ubiquitin-conjugating enzyme E2 [Dillenia turbinata]|uniref:E2 ubiquitin-conjugating enzyme n=1 Tax=Dillenia turbinata TaxID=194707 RepID=A0AAN8UXR1_9MAGN
MDSETSVSQNTSQTLHTTTNHFEKSSMEDCEVSSNLPKKFKSGLNTSDEPSNISFDDNADDENGLDDASDEIDDVSDYDDDDFMYEEDDYTNLQAQFDNVDLPTGVEAPVPWLESPAPSDKTYVAMSSSTSASLQSQQNPQSTVNTGTSSSSILLESKKMVAASSSAVSVDSCSTGVKEDNGEDQVLAKFQNFKSFDTVDSFSDHHYSNEGFVTGKPTKDWAKIIQEEWKILEKDLPDSIFVRVCESRMDLMRAVMIGPAGTPYHDGLFFFDITFPPTYPHVPPMVYYYSGGLRLNPNLYDCGKVCLSLLNTWTGKSTEKWIPGKSTMLQVLVSIQALILNEEPYFNEPGYESSRGSKEGDRRSKEYSEEVFVLSLKTMIYTLRRPPQYYEDFVAGHFRERAHDILAACKAYMEGAKVGSYVRGTVQNGQVSGREDCPHGFRAAVVKMLNALITNFTRNGSEDCEQFRPPA